MLIGYANPPKPIIINAKFISCLLLNPSLSFPVSLTNVVGLDTGFDSTSEEGFSGFKGMW